MLFQEKQNYDGKVIFNDGFSKASVRVSDRTKKCATLKTMKRSVLKLMIISDACCWKGVCGIWKRNEKHIKNMGQ